MRKLLNTIISTVICSLLTLNSGAVSPLPLNRTPGARGSWNGLVGIPGGIPTRNTIYQTFSPGATAAQINSALASCPSNQVVFLNAGTYNLTSQLLINRNGVTLRGAGPNSTIINASGNAVLIGDSNWWNEFATPVVANHRNWIGNYTQGTTVITLDNVAGISVGSLIFLDQLNDPDTTAYSPANPDGPYVNGEYTSIAQPIRGYDRIQFQINRVKSISGNNITLYEPVYMPNWSASLSPQVWFETTPRLTEMCGIEDLAINTDGQDNNPINIQYTYACWVKNCSLSIGIGEHHGYVFPLMSVRPEVRECYIHDVGVHDRYGIHTRMVAGALVENNIFNGHTTMFMVNGVSGSVYAYNYATNIQQNSGYMVSGIYTHGGSPNMCLFEGNRSPQLGLDSQWQNSAYIVSFRNRHVGKDDHNLATGNIQAVGIFATNRHASVIGCVLGKTGVNTVYQDDGTGSCHDGSRVFYLGLESGGSSCSGTFDPIVISTLVRAVNWTSATTTNNGIILDGYNLSDLPNSLYLTAKPAFFGNLRWPPIDPSLPVYSDSQTNIPAGYKFVFGIYPPSGPVAPDTNAPIISSIVTSVGSSNALVSWNTDENSSSILNYGLTASYGLIVSDLNLVPNHFTSLNNLLSNTVYHFKITSTDSSGNLSSSSDQIFTTLNPIIIPPITNIPPILNTNSLVGWWKLNEGSGVNIINSVGNNNGTISGTVTWTSGVNGEALSLNQISYISVIDSGNLQLITNYSYSYWLNLNSPQVAWAGISSKTISGNIQQIDVQFLADGVTLGVQHNNVAAINTGITLNNLLGAWHNVVITYDGTNIRSYLDGVLKVTSALVKPAGNGNGTLFLGKDENSHILNGKIDDIKLYNKALSVAEIQLNIFNTTNIVAVPIIPSAPNNLQIIGYQIISP